MNNSIRIIDDFMPEEQFKKLQEFVVGVHFPWFYVEHVSLTPEHGIIVKDSLAQETAGFAHIMYDRDYKAESFAMEYMQDFFQTITEKLGYNSTHLIRARASIKLQKPGFTEENYNLPHVDYYTPHDTIIFYLHDCDGDTRMFNEFFTPIPGAFGVGHETFTTQQRISPKANRLVVFDGLQYHTASNPLNSKHRIILNINLEKL